MFDAGEFFKHRFSAHLKETSRYLKYIFNGHIAVAMLFFISALAFYYQRWLAELPENFPTALIIGILFAAVATYSPVRTMLQEADLVFILPAEHKMGIYFRNTLIYSFVIQLYLVLLAAAMLGPLYFATFANRQGSMYLLLLLVLLIFKAWNLLANWWMLRIRDKNIRTAEQCVRFLLNFAVFYFAVDGFMELASIATILFISLCLWDWRTSKQQFGLNWNLLVEKDIHRMQTFYRIANMFTDVPHLKTKVKKRQWLTSLVSKNIPLRRKATFDYLYRITFVRSGDYFGMYVRLIIIGGLLIWYVPNMWMKIIFAILFLYMSIFQMMSLYQHHRTIVWLDIYPVEKNVRQQSLLKWLMQLAMLQVILFAVLLAVLGVYTACAVVFVGGSVFSYIFVQGYIKRKITAVN
ncbi:ABC transporter permease [Virgibacillus sp. 179-BFC.A HS]|uniref:ABC transporter permease n=1 Tax=Tigheibacillus jepli TaxID=3035914 RepID=A0ABU5CIR1_9BACI|nr:ABC transporter permease [Virgibacillus sp. 179-BFC.A HS]MDY0406234.1 ABC transporter permease [Virgibacillus sp. 179-BFC.A HS]